MSGLEDWLPVSAPTKKSTCPLCGEPSESIEVGGVKINGCKCVPSDRFYAISFLGDLAAPTGYAPMKIKYQGTMRKPLDPLDVKYDGVTLREWLERDRFNQQEPARLAHPFTIKPAARSAVSAHWSAELRARVAAAKAKERERVVLDVEVDDL